MATKRPLALATAEGPGDRRTSLFEEWRTSLAAAADVLVGRARTMLRPEVTTTVVLALATGVDLAAGTDSEHAHRLAALLRTGLTSRSASKDQT